MDNHQRIGNILNQLRDGLRPFVERELHKAYGKYWITRATERWTREVEIDDDDKPVLDALGLLRIMQENWNEVFFNTLGHSDRSHVNELREARNKWAHSADNHFTDHETLRVMETALLLLKSVSAPNLTDVEKARDAMAQLVYPSVPQTEVPNTNAANASLKAWRQVVSPHKDVQNGTLRQAEFAADLQQVLDGIASREYMDPSEFFHRTYLTNSLSDMLISAIKRLSGEKVDPVIQLQTNFGGGKTHSMLALYHLFGGSPVDAMPGVKGLLDKAGYQRLPKVNRAVLVGTRLQPGTPTKTADGLSINTIWGEMAYQLGGKAGYEIVRQADETSTNPGKALGKLFEQFGPCLVLIDEWVAYARQLSDRADLCGGSFDTQFTFAQALTEEAAASKNCLVLISVPVSDRNDNQKNDIEIGGRAGAEALERLRNVVARVESSWRPATTEESFEIVRRRLFQPIESAEQIKARDAVASAHVAYYRENKDYFPTDAQGSDYEERLRKAYPIHPELFDRLYTDWGTSTRFQRTRGVLRLMASVIHHLWQAGHNQPLILPSDIAINDEDVQSELTRNLTENWRSVIEKDIDGDASLPFKMDSENSNFGRANATRRIARALFMGSAPLVDAQRKGMDARRVLLGSVPVGETPANFSDALNRLALNATYLYQDKEMYWYALSPTVVKVATERQRDMLKDPHRMQSELKRRLQKALMERGEFDKIHILPDTSADIIDEPSARLVVLGKEAAYRRGNEEEAFAAIRGMVMERGNSPRRFRNALVFVVPDANGYKDLEESIAYYLAWNSIVLESEALNLTAQQKRNAEENAANRESEVAVRLQESYSWLISPVQDDPKGDWTLEPMRIAGQSMIARKASQKLKEQDLLISSLAGSILRQTMDKYNLWDGDHRAARDLVEYFATYPFLQRLKDPAVLLKAIADGSAAPSWRRDTFGIADAYDAKEKRYLSLTGGDRREINDPSSSMLLVRAEVAGKQLDEENKVVVTTPIEPPLPPEDDDGNTQPTPPQPPARSKPKRYTGSVRIRSDRSTKHVNDIMSEVVANLAGLVGVEVTIQLEISAKLADGFEEGLIRTVTENGKVLGFNVNAFEEE